MDDEDQQPDTNANRKVIQRASDPEGQYGHQNQTQNNRQIIDMVAPDQQWVFAKEVENQPQEEDEADDYQRDRRANQGCGSTRGDDNGVIDGEVSGVSA